MVRAGGNERELLLTDANDDGFANDPRVIAVAAVRKNGRACSYSSPGACLLVAAPSGDILDLDEDGFPETPDPDAPDVLSTDRTGVDGYNTNEDETGDYAGFNGTSASAPQVAGVAALIIGANPNVTVRDVQQILLLSARHYDLDDPAARLNGAGLRVSHNVGFGIPDAGFAVEMARNWSNRPPVTRLSFTNQARQNIPDDGLRLICTGEDLPERLTSIRCLPSSGPHPDEPTPVLPIVYLGQANEEITESLQGKAALIERGTSYFWEKIERAARAGAAFAVVYNNVGTTEIQPMGGTVFVPIPAVSIGKDDGEALREILASQPEVSAQLRVSSAVFHFAVTNTLSCEHVGLRLKTTHSRRSDVRVTLVSPMGTRSILQAINRDGSRGPTDWTFWSCQHFYESSSGEWRLEVSDERNTTIRTFPSGSIAATGAVTYAQLILTGVAIEDGDADGLDDAWESKWYADLGMGPKDDPDQDGFSNAREQVLGTDPTFDQRRFVLDVTALKPGYWRFSWPAGPGKQYTLQSNIDLQPNFQDSGTAPAQFPVSELVIPAPSAGNHFYRLRSDSVTPDP
jgi:subtilisin-like proprotein convertase family protein